MQPITFSSSRSFSSSSDPRLGGSDDPTLPPEKKVKIEKIGATSSSSATLTSATTQMIAAKIIPSGLPYESPTPPSPKRKSIQPLTYCLRRLRDRQDGDGLKGYDAQTLIEVAEHIEILNSYKDHEMNPDLKAEFDFRLAQALAGSKKPGDAILLIENQIIKQPFADRVFPHNYHLAIILRICRNQKDDIAKVDGLLKVYRTHYRPEIPKSRFYVDIASVFRGNKHFEHCCTYQKMAINSSSDSASARNTYFKSGLPSARDIYFNYLQSYEHYCFGDEPSSDIKELKAKLDNASPIEKSPIAVALSNAYCKMDKGPALRLALYYLQEAREFIAFDSDLLMGINLRIFELDYLVDRPKVPDNYQ